VGPAAISHVSPSAGHVSVSGRAYLFLLQQRLPIGLMRGGWKPWLSTMATNLAIALVSVVMIRTVCLRPFLLVHLPVTLIGASLGVWLFYVQHQFEQTYWARGRDWSLHDVALYGSSLYDLPRALG
jgi:omega-6 fatty acid desaturase (delta-12 desaturase)